MTNITALSIRSNMAVSALRFVWACILFLRVCGQSAIHVQSGKSGKLDDFSNINITTREEYPTASARIISMKSIQEELKLHTNMTQDVGFNGEDFLSTSFKSVTKTSVFVKVAQDQPIRLRTKRSIFPIRPPRPGPRPIQNQSTPTAGTEFYAIDRKKTIKQIVIDTHSFVCGESAMSSRVMPYRVCRFDCLPCYYGRDCETFGDCCPDFNLSKADSVLSEYESCLSYNWTTWGEVDRMIAVDTCPENFTGPSVAVEKCENADFTIKQEATPVSEQSGKKVYKNIFCAECHGVRNTTAWKHVVTCADGRQLATIKTDNDLWSLVVSMDTCSVKSYPSNEMEIPRCLPSFITTCNATGKMLMADEWMRPLCHSYTNPVRDTYNDTIYGNIFCAMCNGILIKNEKKICPLSTQPVSPFPLSVVLQFTSHRSYQEEVTSPERCAYGETTDPFSGSCLSLQCQETHKLEGSECTQRYSSFRGIGFTVDVFLSSDSVFIPNLEPLREIKNKLTSETKLIFKAEAVLITRLYIRFLNKHPSTLENTTFAFVRTELISGKQGPWSQMETKLRKYVSLNFTMKLDGVMHSISVSPSTRTVPDRVLEGGTDFIKMIPVRAESRLTNGCKPREVDCLSNVFYIPVLRKPECPFISYNMTSLELTYNASANEVVFKDYKFKVIVSEINQCGNIINICSATLKEISTAKQFQDNRKTANIHTDTDPALTILSLICLSISLVGLFLTFLVYTSQPKLHTVHGQIILFLVVYLFLAQFLFLLGSNWTSDSFLCQAFGVAIHFFWVASFSWMVASAVHMMSVFTKITSGRRDRANDPRYVIRYIIICNVVAVLFVGICLAFYLGRSAGAECGYGGNVCFLNNVWSIGAFFAFPLCLMLLINILCFSKTILAIKAVPDTETSSNQANKTHIFVCIKLSILVSFSWIFGLTGSLVDLMVFKYIFIVLTGSQGIFILTAYCMNQRVWRMMTQSFSVLSSSGTDDSSLQTDNHVTK